MIFERMMLSLVVLLLAQTAFGRTLSLVCDADKSRYELHVDLGRSDLESLQKAAVSESFVGFFTRSGMADGRTPFERLALRGRELARTRECLAAAVDRGSMMRVGEVAQPSLVFPGRRADLPAEKTAVRVGALESGLARAENAFARGALEEGFHALGVVTPVMRAVSTQGFDLADRAQLVSRFETLRARHFSDGLLRCHGEPPRLKTPREGPHGLALRHAWNLTCFSSARHRVRAALLLVDAFAPSAGGHALAAVLHWEERGDTALRSVVTASSEWQTQAEQRRHVQVGADVPAGLWAAGIAERLLGARAVVDGDLRRTLEEVLLQWL